MLRAIFWDNDGVLVDTERLYLQASREALTQAGTTLSEAQYVAIVLGAGTSILDLARQRGAGEAEITRLRGWRNTRYAELLATESTACADVPGVLAALHGRYQMGIVTSSLREHFDIIHRRVGLLPFFDWVLLREDFTHTKPHPEPYLKAIARSGCRADECVVIEDTERGLTAARAAGLRCLIVPTHLTRGRPFAGATRVLSRLTDVPTALAEL